jgi:hypothetical protein
VSLSALEERLREHPDFAFAVVFSVAEFPGERVPHGSRSHGSRNASPSAATN